MNLASSSVHRVLIADPEGLLGAQWIDTLKSHDQQDPWLKKMEIQLIIEQARQPDEVLRFLRAGQFSTFVLGVQNPEEWLETLILAHQISPLTTTLVVASQWTDQSLRSFINTARIHRPLTWSGDRTELSLQLGEAMLDGEILHTQETLFLESRQQNKELQGLTERLEEIVKDRTLSIEKSKDEIEDSLTQARNLIRFTQNAAQRSSFEDIMTLIRRELKRFAKIGDPLLLLQLQEDAIDILSFRVGLLQESKIKKKVKLPRQNTFFDKELTANLANLMGRPFHKVVAFPLDIALIRKFGYADAAAVLCFESQMTDFEMTEFLSQFQQFLKPITIAVDRLFLERELTLQSFRWEKTFDGLRDPIAVIDREYRVLRSNNKFAAKVVKAKCFEMFAQRSSPCEDCPLEKSLNSGHSETSQIEKGGRTFRVESHPIQLPGTLEYNSVVNQYTDLTPTKEIYARMLQSEKMSAIGMLAAHIAHELNNPLTGIQSLAQILVQDAQDPELQIQPAVTADLQEIEKAARRSQIIIRNLLDFTGDGDHQLTALSWENLWQKTYPLLKTVLGNHSVRIEFRHSETLVQVDPHLIQQVIFNIINNACQALGKKGTIWVTDFLDTKNQKVGLSIRDSGPGIPMDMSEKIFEPFFTTKKENQGTGLGLSLSRDILRKYNGELALKKGFEEESHSNDQIKTDSKGAEFLMTLPVYQGV